MPLPMLQRMGEEQAAAAAMAVLSAQRGQCPAQEHNSTQMAPLSA